MENEKILVLRLELTQKRCLFALTLAFLCFQPRPLGSETQTLTTYYPAPYGGYVALLTTGGSATSPVDTLLARDAGNVGIGMGTSTPQAKLHVQGEILSVVDGVNYYMIPKGVIVIWSGSISGIPSGWQLCDGTTGTPDLRSKFVYGAGTLSPGATGGSKTHEHSIDPPSTKTDDAWPPPGRGFWRTSGGYWQNIHRVDIPAFDSKTGGELPPYYALAYIMRT